MRKLILLLLCLSLLVSGAMAEPVQLHVDFPYTATNEKLTQPTVIEDSWFDAPSSSYNHQLAKLSICMAVASFRDKLAPLPESDHYLISFLEQAGFEDYHAYGYDEAPGADTISNGIAVKHLIDAEGEYVLLAVPVCGQGYGDEWLSNFAISAGNTHSGFLSAAQKVYARVKDFIRVNGLDGQRVKIWTAGFSRSAAVCNLLGDMLLSDPDFVQDNIFIYTFGTPNTTKTPVAYPQIFNICGGFDPVPKIPFADWGFGKHGITYYLPALETDACYAAEKEMAIGVWQRLMGNTDGFASLPERNWLIGKILETLYDFVPESAVYSESYQAAVIAAYGTKGSLLDKLDAMLIALDQAEEDTAGAGRVRDDLMTLLSLGVTDTVNVLTGHGGSSMWYDLMTSGLMLAHEHFAETYISWLFSTDDAELLFGQDSRYACLVLSGDVDVRVTQGDTVLMDGMEGSLAVTRLEKQMFISLPAGHTYDVTVTAQSDTRCNVAFSNASVRYVSMTLSSTNALTLHPGDFVTVEVPDCHDTAGKPVVKLNGSQEMAMYGGEHGGNYARLFMENGQAITQEMRSIINSAVIMAPWLLCSTVLLLYVLSVLLKRLVRGDVDDRAACQKPGRFLLIIAAVLAGMTALNVAMMIIGQIRSADAVVLTNHTLQRAAEILGLGNYGYQVSQVVIYLVAALLCVRSIGHQLSRIRLMRLSFVLVVLDLMTLFLGRVFDTISVTELMVQLVPVLSIAGLVLSIRKDDPRRMVGKRWLPVSRTVLVTAIIFFVRQSYVFIFDETAMPAVIMKAISGVPVVLLALLIWKRRTTRINLMTLQAIGCYFVANTVINLSMPAALLIYTVGHCLLVYAYIKAQPKLSKPRIIVWAAVSLFFEAQLFGLQQNLELLAKIMACVYIVSIVGILVTAQKVSKRVQLGSVLFLVSNQILSITLMFPGDFLLESVELLLYYIAVIIMAADPAALGVPSVSADTLVQEQ